MYTMSAFQIVGFKFTFMELESTVSGRRQAEVKTGVKLWIFCHTTACFDSRTKFYKEMMFSFFLLLFKNYGLLLPYWLLLARPVS